MIYRLPTLLLVGLLSSAGCATLFGQVESPEVYVIDIAPAKGGLLEQRVNVDLRIRNPNDFDLQVSGLDFRLDVNGTRLARGLSNQEVTVPRLGESIVSVEASTTVMDLVRQLLNIGKHPELAYEITGWLHLENTGMGRVSFERSATLVEK